MSACSIPLDELDTIFYDGDDRKVHCGANLDEKANLTDDEVLASLDRAAARSEVVEFYAHKPNQTVSVERIELVLAGARDRGLAFVTYADLGARVTGPGIALSFDDRDAAGWFSLRPLFATYDARVTFFVSGYGYLSEEERVQVRQLHADGHDIAAHSRDHKNAPSYVEEYGLRAYMDEQVLSSIQILEEEGFTVTSFAYPFGARTSETDDAILEHVPIVRAIDFPFRSSIQSTCPL